MSFGTVFWGYKDALAAQGVKGFAYFSLPHLLWLGVIAVLLVAYCMAYHSAGERGKDTLRKSLAVFLIFYEIANQCTLVLTGAPVISHLPIEICSFGQYTILLDALWPKNKAFKRMLLFVFLPAAVIALLVPTATAFPPINYFTIHQFLMHGFIVIYILARYREREIPVSYGGFWQAVGLLIALVIPMYVLDRLLDKNYMFLMFHYENPVLRAIWDLTGGNGGIPYTLGLVIVFIAMLHLWFAAFILVEKLSRRSGR
jgi:uncharacterized membrane protein YwaF